MSISIFCSILNACFYFLFKENIYRFGFDFTVEETIRNAWGLILNVVLLGSQPLTAEEESMAPRSLFRD